MTYMMNNAGEFFKAETKDAVEWAKLHGFSDVGKIIFKAMGGEI